jgi:RND superfamily putative drug exporter
MLEGLARFDIRFRWLIVAAWIAGTVAAVRLLPSLTDVAQTNTTRSLPASSPSLRAGELAAPFPDGDPSNTALIVAERTSGPLTAADDAALGRAEAAARRVPGVALVADAGTSPDGRAAGASVAVTAAAANHATASDDAVRGIRAAFAGVGAPPGLSLYLTGPLAVRVDGFNVNSGGINRATLIVVVVLLFLVYRAALAPLITLLPAALAVALSGPLIAATTRAGLAVPSIAQLLLVVLVLGAGSDYGLFLTFRFREELAGGRPARPALVAAVGRVGAAIAYSGLTVAAALLALLLAPFGFYRGLGPGLAIGIAIMLAASLTLTPALLAIFGRAAFWPVRPGPGPRRAALWGWVAARAVRRPAWTLAAGLVLFGALAAGLVGYRIGGLNRGAPAGSDSAAGAAALAAHFPDAVFGSEQLLLRFASSAWDDPAPLARAQAQLAADPTFRSVTGPLGSGSGALSSDELAALRAALGPADALPRETSGGGTVDPARYAAYRATARFIGPDGRTVRFYAIPRAGAAGSTAAVDAIPQVRAALDAVARATGARESGVAGQDATAYDINFASNASLALVVPIVLMVILVLLGLLLRSLVAPWYLALTVGLSYLASLGFAMLAFVRLGGDEGLIFVLPLLMFVFAMALGEDYNILVMSRIREEARTAPGLPAALTRAIGVTGGTITAAGVILAGTFAVLGVGGGGSDIRQLGFSIAFGVLLDTFFVRTLLIPSIAMLLGRWNWWPSGLSRAPAAPTPAPETSTAES